MPAPRTRPGDVTGKIKEKLEADAAAQRESRSSEIAMITAVTAAEESEVVDYSQGPPTVQQVSDEPEVINAEDPDKPVTITVNSDLEQVTIGHGNQYDFKAGRKYTVPRHVSDHLEEKGYIWH